jgi:hypothetical protein
LRKRRAPGLLALGSFGIIRLLQASPDDAITRAGALATQVIQAPGDPRLPLFLTWFNRSELDRSCTASPQKSKNRGLVGISPSYYDTASQQRLCAPALSGNYTQKPPRLVSGQVDSWMDMQAGGVPKYISPAYPEKSHAAAALWQRLLRNPQPVLRINLSRANGPASAMVSVKLPPGVFGTAGCKELQKPEVNTSVASKSVNLEEFYWIKITDGDHVSNTACGDIAILVGFNVIEKVCVTPGAPNCKGPTSGQSGWLWATFWWDGLTPSPSHVVPTPNAAHEPNWKAGWQNYRYNASYDSSSPLVNPWAENSKSNCAHCHAGAQFRDVSTNDAVFTGPLPEPGPRAMRADFIFAAPIHEHTPYSPR